MKEAIVIDDKILIELIEEEAVKSKIIVTDSVRKSLGGEKPLKGKVVSIGLGVKGHVEMVVKIGDIVLFPEISGVKLDIGGNKRIVMRQAEIYCILPK